MHEVRRPLAAFYERHLAIAADVVLDWVGRESPRRVPVRARHVTVARDTSYAVDEGNRLVGWSASTGPAVLLEDVACASAGESGLLAITCSGDLLERRADAGTWTKVARGVRQAWVGDSSNYYVTSGGDLYAAGLAHRGQYGDGLLTAVDGWKHVASGVSWVCAHTGHAVFLGNDGRVEGTGGNRFGPLGTHGFGDKADRWGVLFEGATIVATGARHTVAARADGGLWIWGENEGLQPRLLMTDVTAVACGDADTLARTADGRLWQWATGEAPLPAPIG